MRPRHVRGTPNSPTHCSEPQPAPSIHPQSVFGEYSCTYNPVRSGYDLTRPRLTIMRPVWVILDLYSLVDTALPGCRNQVPLPATRRKKNAYSVQLRAVDQRNRKSRRAKFRVLVKRSL
eukprot:2375260-Prymnesium_polylepis.1